jgi:hypothetical protein
MSIAADLGAGLIGAGGKCLGIGMTFWNQITGGMLKLYLLDNPASHREAFQMVSTGPLWSAAEVIGMDLAFLYFLWGWIRDSLDIKADFTVENIFREILHFLLLAGLILNLDLIINESLTLSALIANAVSLNAEHITVREPQGLSAIETVEPDFRSEEYRTFLLETYGEGADAAEGELRDSYRKAYRQHLERKRQQENLEAYGYFSSIYVSLEKVKDTSKATWLFSGVICLIAGLIGGFLAIRCSVKMILTAADRLFNILLCIPFAPSAFAGFAGGRTFEDRGRHWISVFSAYLLEAPVILLSINLCGVLVREDLFYGLFAGSREQSVTTVLLRCLSMVIPILICTEVVGKARDFLRGILGI